MAVDTDSVVFSLSTMQNLWMQLNLFGMVLMHGYPLNFQVRRQILGIETMAFVHGETEWVISQ